MYINNVNLIYIIYIFVLINILDLISDILVMYLSINFKNICTHILYIFIVL